MTTTQPNRTPVTNRERGGIVLWRRTLSIPHLLPARHYPKERAMNMKIKHRYIASHPCPICGRIGVGPTPHCHGILSDDGSFARCTNNDGSGMAKWDEKCLPPAWVWKQEPDGTYRPWTKEPPPTPIRVSTSRRVLRPGSPLPASHPPGVSHDTAAKTHARTAGIRYFTYNETQRVYRRDYCVSGKWDKDVFSQHRDADGQWQFGDGPGPLVYVYRREDLITYPTNAVLLAEGELCVDALAAHDFLAVTWRGGTGRVAHALSQLVDVLTGREVILWPDADEPGRKAMHTIARALVGKATRVQWCDPYGDESKRDAEDWLCERAAEGTAA